MNEEFSIGELTLSNANALRSLGEVRDSMRNASESAKGLTSATKEFNQASTSMGAATESVTGRLRDVDREYKRLMTSIGGTTEATERHAAIVRRLDADLAKNSITADQHAAALTKVSARYGVASDAAERSARSTKLAAHEVTNLSYQLQDATVQLAGGQSPFLVMMQQGPQATSAVGGVGRAISLLTSPIGIAFAATATLAGGLALIGTRAASISSQTRDLTVTMRAYGTETQATAGMLRDLAKEIYGSGAGKDEANAAAKVLASTRGMSAAMGKEVAGLANDMAAGLGKTVDEATKQVAELVTEGYPAIKRLQDQIGFLDADEAKAIRTMAEHGQQAQALSVAMGALHRRFDGLREESMSPTNKAFHELGVGWNSFMDAVAQSKPVMDAISGVSGAVTRMAAAVSSTPKQQVAELETQLTELKRRQGVRDAARSNGEKFIGIYSLWDLFGATDGSDMERQIADIERRLSEARKRVVESISTGKTRTAGTFQGANSAGGKTDEKAVQYVDSQTAAYERLDKAMSGNRSQRYLNMAAMKAEDDIRDNKLQGDLAEELQALRLKGALLELRVAYRDQLDSLDLSVRGNLALAAAYGQSEMAAIRQKAANDAMAAAAENAAVNVAELTKRNIEAGAAQSAVDLSRQTAELRRQADLQWTIARAAGESGIAQQEAERHAEVLRATSGALAQAQAAEAAGNVELASHLRDLAGAYDQASQANARAVAVTPVCEFPDDFLESDEAMQIAMEAFQ